VGIAYAIALTVGFAVHGLAEPIVDPILAVMEVLTVLSALPMVVLMAAIHSFAAADRKVFGVVALAFTILFAGATIAVHFVELTARRQLGSAGIVWPSAAYAVELLAWNLLLGLALLFAARVFAGMGRERNVRRGMHVTGLLCIAGVVGPVVGNMRLQLVGVFGYAAALPVVCLMVASVFHHHQRTLSPNTTV
jgi:hypothetical protein